MLTHPELGKSIYDLATPCLVVDEDVLRENIARMQARVSGAGKELRPHAKTHRCLSIARMQVEAGSRGVCVATVGEAEVCVEGGIDDVLVTSPVVPPGKIDRLLACAKKTPRLAAVVDSAANASALSRAAAAAGVRLSVLIDIDPGLGRTGVPFDRAAALAEEVDRMKGLSLRGVQCYAGHLQHVHSYEERRRACRETAERLEEVLDAFRRAGLCAEVCSGGGTGSHWIDCGFPAFTEIQAGSYVVMDAEYLAVEWKEGTRFAPSLTLLTTVVSANRGGWVTVDAGLKSVYHHGAPPRVLRPCGLEAEYEWFGDEHGKLLLRGRKRPAPGDVVELVVSHCDPTINLFDEIFVARDGRVVDVWRVEMRGRSR